MAAAGGAGRRDRPQPPLARPIPAGKTVPATTFCSLYAEMINYFTRGKKGSIAELEARLSDVGHGVGYRMLELFSLRTGKRELDVVNMVKLVSGPIWTHLFGKTADHLDVNKDAASPECASASNDPTPLDLFIFAASVDFLLLCLCCCCYLQMQIAFGTICR